MISSDDRIKVIEIAKKYDVSKIYLFGSSVANEEANDIDLGVEGISENIFFKFYSELIFNLARPVDLIHLKEKNLFNNIVKSEGILLYE